MSHDVTWTQPPTLSGSGAARPIVSPRAVLDAPAILRFATDGFMQEFMSLLETSPDRLAGYRLRKETWRGFSPTPIVEPPRPASMVLQRLGIAGRKRADVTGAPTRTAPATPAGTPLKLYQPAHQRFYLVTCSLVCRVVGLPDKAIDSGTGEQVGCLVRRLLPPAGREDQPVSGWEEHAWVTGEHGAVWQRVSPDSSRLVPGEELVPLFAVSFAEQESRRRRMFAGVVPVGRREAYLGAPRTAGGTSAGVTSRTSRKILLRKEVIEPWKSLLRRAQETATSFVGPFVGDNRAPTLVEKAARLKLEREQIQTVSWLVLLDFAKYLSTYLPPVWQAIVDPARRSGLPVPQRDLFDVLQATTVSTALAERLRHRSETSAAGDELYAASAVLTSLRQALSKFAEASGAFNVALEQQIENVDEGYDRHDAARRALWPAFLFPLADPDLQADAAVPPALALGTLTSEEQDEVALDEDERAGDPLERVDRLAVLVLRALEDEEPQSASVPAVPAAAIAPANPLEGWFVLRCVYDRPACAPLHPAVVSGPTEAFQMAGFFDPDAPARPIRIGLPLDTTPAGLRKFDKNTAFTISDTLCGQMRRLRGITLGDLVLSVLPWPLHKDLPIGSDNGPCRTDAGLSLGMICSISIPIITLCAFVLLTIMVTLLDFVFRWLPYFVVCFPVPGLKAKRPPSPA